MRVLVTKEKRRPQKIMVPDVLRDGGVVIRINNAGVVEFICADKHKTTKAHLGVKGLRRLRDKINTMVEWLEER